MRIFYPVFRRQELAAGYRYTTGQWRLGIDHPLRLLQGREELAPGRGRLPALALPLQAEALLDGRLPQRGQEGASKEATEDAYRQEEMFGTRDPGGAVQCH